MKPQPFTRPTIIAAIELLGAASSQAKFDQAIVRLGLNNEIQLASTKSVTAKSALLAQAVTQRATHIVDTVNGQMTLAEATVRTAVEASMPEYGKPEQAAFLRGLSLDGYVVSWDEDSRAPCCAQPCPKRWTYRRPTMKSTSSGSISTLSCPWGTLIRQSKRIRGAIGRRRTARHAASWKDCSMTSQCR